MKEIIPFTKEIVFPNNIATITSISLEHEEKIYSGEVSGDFIIYGDYKSHNDTTETENFKYRLPYSTLLPENINYDTIKIDIINFTYNQIENDVLNIKIDYKIEGELIKEQQSVKEIDFEAISNIEDKKTNEPSLFDEELNDFLENYKSPTKTLFNEEETEEELLIPCEEERENDIITNIIDNSETTNIINMNEEKEETKKEEYVTYHIHIMKEDEIIENIIKDYNGNIETVQELNNISEIKPGDKIIIPEYHDE